MATINMYVGNTAPSITDTLSEVKSNGLPGPLDLTLPTVAFRMRSQFGSALLIDAPAVIVGMPQDGMVRYDWALLDTTTAINNHPGAYKAWWHLDYGGSVTVDTPEFWVMFYDHAPRLLEVGPCTDWATSQDIVACFSDVTPGSCLSSATRMASEVLYELSGRQFPGWCQSVIRPCGPSCLSCSQILSRGHVITWDDGGGWCADDEPCGCGGTMQAIPLPGSAQGVVEVLLSGVVLDPAAYRLDPDGLLVRVDGGAWPTCQNMSVAGDEPGAFQVTYSHGYAPPEVGRRAAAQLAREFWLACSGQACRLPAGVVEIVRQGIRITRAASLFQTGATGLEMVDSFLAAYPQHPAVIVMSPDTQETSRRM